MKKVLFYLPAVIYTIAVVALNIILKTFSPLWYAWVVLLWLGRKAQTSKIQFAELDTDPWGQG